MRLYTIAACFHWKTGLLLCCTLEIKKKETPLVAEKFLSFMEKQDTISCYFLSTDEFQNVFSCFCMTFNEVGTIRPRTGLNAAVSAVYIFRVH